MLELHQYGYIGLFVGCFLAATVLPFSSEALVILMLKTRSELMLTIGIASLGNWLGGMSGYYLGYIGKWEWIEKYLKVKEEKIERFKIRVARFQGLAAFLCWLPFVGDLIAITLGVLRCNKWIVSIFMFVGKWLRYCILGYCTLKLLA